MRITGEDKWAAAFMNLLKVPIGAWTLMLAVGIAHNDWWPALPPIGYWTALAVYVLLPYGATAYARDMAADREGKENQKAYKALRATTLGAVVDGMLAARRRQS